MEINELDRGDFMLIKKIFNYFLSEEKKEIIRKKYIFLFQATDRIIMYMEYKRAVKRILRKIFFKGKSYAYRNNGFLKIIRGEYFENIILTESDILNNAELQKCINYINKQGIDVFCYSDMHVSLFSRNEIHYDKEKQMFYTLYLDKRLYLKRSINSVDQAVRVVNDLAIEQLQQSPHCYLTNCFKPKENDTIFDIGCAEGNFTLSVIDVIDKAYLFECDMEWIEALQATFEPWKEKVEIVPLMVSNENSDTTVTLGEFCRKRDIDNIDFVKMDVEGAEERVVEGATDLFHHRKIKKIAIAIYHNYEDEEKFCQFLKRSDYDIEIPGRYMFWNTNFEISKLSKKIYTHGIIRATLKRES